MKHLYAFLSIALLHEVVQSVPHVCSDSLGVTYVDCPLRRQGGGGGGVEHIPNEIRCCRHEDYNGLDNKLYEFLDGDFDLVIEALDLDVNEKLVIKKFDCLGSCKWIELNSSVPLPLIIHIDGTRFTLSSDGDDIYVYFSIEKRNCVCRDPCDHVHRVSGEYDVTYNGVTYRIYCEFISYERGFVYLSTESLKQNPNPPLNKFHNEHDCASIKFKRGRRQKTSIITQLEENRDIDLNFTVNYEDDGYITEPYLSLGFVPEDILKEGGTQGYRYNGKSFFYKKCIGETSSYFTFDTRNLAGTRINKRRHWFKSGIDLGEILPDQFFYFLEETGGCGDVFSTPWVALGLPFRYVCPTTLG